MDGFVMQSSQLFNQFVVSIIHSLITGYGWSGWCSPWRIERFSLEKNSGFWIKLW